MTISPINYCIRWDGGSNQSSEQSAAERGPNNKHTLDATLNIAMFLAQILLFLTPDRVQERHFRPRPDNNAYQIGRPANSASPLKPLAYLLYLKCNSKTAQIWMGIK
jgi:hypothetical protein